MPDKIVVDVEIDKAGSDDAVRGVDDPVADGNACTANQRRVDVDRRLDLLAEVLLER